MEKGKKDRNAPKDILMSRIVLENKRIYLFLEPQI